MQACFYYLSGVLPMEKALKLLKDDIVKLYSGKGPKVVAMNTNAVDETISNLKEIKYPENW